jgi:hypothetical protein
LAQTASYVLNAVSSSYAFTASSATNAFNSISASYAFTASSAINSFSASKSISSSYADTASFANNFTVLGNLTVFGTQSVQYITSSQLNVSDNVITVNVASPGVRFGGLSVYDSGSLSSEATASLFWDSQNNHWIYQRESGSTYNGGMLISGPRNFAGLGNEQGTTSNFLMKGQGGDHITSSAIFEESGSVSIGTTSAFGKLSVVGTDNTTISSALWGTSTGAGLVSSVYNGSQTANSVAGIRLITRDSGASVWNIYNVSTGGDSGDLAFGNGSGGAGTEKLRILNSGNVGIGTSSPTVKLQINGQTTYEPMVPGAATGSFAVNAANGTYGLYIASRGAGDTWMQVGRNDGTATAYNLLMQVNGGNVGIGKVSPVAKLDVAGEGRFTDMQVTGSAGSKVSIYSNYSGGNPGMSMFNTSGTEVIWLNAANASVNASAFNIGTTARNYLSAGSLRVTSAGDNASTLDISVSNGTTNINSNYYSGGGDNTIIIGTYANYTNQLVLKSNGRIGIGNTNPAFTLDVNGGIRTTGLAILNNYSAQYTTDSSWTSFQNVIPANTLNQYETYLVELSWFYASPTFAPYYASAAFLFRPVPTNATGTNNAIVLQTSCHIGGDYLITVAQQNFGNASSGGLAAKLSWSTASPSYIIVTAKRIAIP